MAHDPREAAELEMDRVLGIRTCGRDESHASLDESPYEPTPYAVLDRVASSGLVGKGSLVVDYGCGKGRVGLYLAYQTRCRCMGIERDRWLYEAALRNQQAARSGRRCSFEQADARDYVPPDAADRLFFFNPFSAAVFDRVLGNLAESLRRAPRSALLMLYYPDDGFLALLEQTPWIAPMPEASIGCRDLFGGDDPRERVAVYRTVRP